MKILAVTACPTGIAHTYMAAEAIEEAAKAIVGYATLHAASATGQVPYREWPQEIKGHFVTRHPPLPEGDDA
mgnify:CR=1 FL=1